MAVPLAGPPALIDPYDGETDLKRRQVCALWNAVFTDDPARLPAGPAPRRSARLRYRTQDPRLDSGPCGPRVVGCRREGPGRAHETARRQVNRAAAQGPGPDGGSSARSYQSWRTPGASPSPKSTIGTCSTTPSRPRGRSNGCSNLAVGAASWGLGPTWITWTNTLHNTQATAHSAESGKIDGLLHDISKPATKTIEPSGRIRFFGHHTGRGQDCEGDIDEAAVQPGGRRAREYHDRQPPEARPDGKTRGAPDPASVYRFHRDLGDAALDTVYLNLADYLAARGPDLDEEDWRYRRQVAGAYPSRRVPG